MPQHRSDRAVRAVAVALALVGVLAAVGCIEGIYTLARYGFAGMPAPDLFIEESPDRQKIDFLFSLLIGAAFSCFALSLAWSLWKEVHAGAVKAAGVVLGLTAGAFVAQGAQRWALPDQPVGAMLLLGAVVVPAVAVYQGLTR